MRDLRVGVWFAIAVLTFTIALVNLSAHNRRQHPPTMIHPLYHPDKEPSGHLERLKVVERESLTFDFSKINGHFVPVAQSPFPFANGRYSDEQLYALAQFMYSLQPPTNPNAASPLTRRGQEVFARAGCGACHTPPLDTNNKLIPAQGFRPATTGIEAPDVMLRPVGTNPDLALRTRRGTGYYKVPSLKGVSYRGPLEHSGSVATLENWFDSRRLRDDYVPTGWKGYGIKTRAVQGHEFGLTLSPPDKRALIAFLKTL